ncbi:hypothetical protein [Methylogaea oryzae]|uniref:Uncharacterized protein n=1 Tax=Methylogaea oryzae TaxID=1295382 RepID=A0A8D4VPM4_9GAMM|nr:hypothetical protein [Methylogaea oryzae]BBL71735.1 hypothetical protein MoryE10_23410 [Methylogaea oryzae]
MRFFVTGEQNRQLTINTIVLLFLGYVLLLWISNGLMFFHKMSLAPQSVIDYYLGSEEKFTKPISYQTLLEVSHFHLFAMGMLVLTLTHLLLFTPLAMGPKLWLTGLTFFSALADEGAGWLVRFVHPHFAYFKIGAFLALEASLLALLVFCSLSLYYQRKHLSAPHSHKHRHSKRRHK